jgi:hypothetical protein
MEVHVNTRSWGWYGWRNRRCTCGVLWLNIFLERTILTLSGNSKIEAKEIPEDFNPLRNYNVYCMVIVDHVKEHVGSQVAAR